MTLRMLMASTALAGLLATGALAQEAVDPAQAAPMATTSSEPMRNAGAGEFVQRQENDQYLSSNLNGATVYETIAPNARSVGEISDFVVDMNGKVAAVVIATSVLNNNKTIAAPVGKLEWSRDRNGDPRVAMKAPVAELQSAPEFIAQAPSRATSNGAAVPGTGAAGTTAGSMMAPGADMAANGAATPAGGTAMATGGAMATGSPVATNGAVVPGADGNDAVAVNTMAAGNTVATGRPVPRSTGDDTATAGNAMVGGDMANGYLAALQIGQQLSENIIGSNVFGGPGNDAETVGSVNDLVMTASGDVPTAVIGVGGFLGIGEKNVGVPFARLQMQPTDDSDGRLYLAATKDQLQAAPSFESLDRRRAAANTAPAAGASMTSGGAMVPAAGMAATDPMVQQGTIAPGSTAVQPGAMAGGMIAGGATANAAPSTTSSASADVSSSMQPVAGPELTADSLDGVSVFGPNDRSIGSVSDIALSADGRVDAIIVDVGGFLGIGSKPVAVAMDNLRFLRDTNGRVNVYTQFTEDQLKNAPGYDRATYAQNRNTMRITQSNAPAAGTAQPAK